jgi:hypothetical protein
MTRRWGLVGGFEPTTQRLLRLQRTVGLRSDAMQQSGLRLDLHRKPFKGGQFLIR